MINCNTPANSAIASLTADDITIHDHVATVAAGDQLTEIVGVDDPAACRVCVLAAWIRAVSLSPHVITKSESTALGADVSAIAGTRTENCKNFGSRPD